jgi:hypothetical protein
MPAVCDLGRLGQCFGRSQRVCATTVAGDYRNLRLLRQPSSCCRGLAIRQKRDRSPPLQISDERPVVLIAPPRPIVDPDHGRRHKERTAASSDDPKQRILADRHHEPTCKAGRRSAAKRQTKVMDDMIENAPFGVPMGRARRRRSAR